MKKRLICLALLFCSFCLCAQQPTCNCSLVLEKLIKKVETEYPGFGVKTKDKLAYQEFQQNLIKEAQKADQSACEKVLKKYTDFFKDPHLWVGANGSPFSSGIGGRTEMITFNSQDFQTQVKATQDPLEGIWTTAGYKIGIKKVSEKEYVGFIIEAQSTSWKAGEIKFKLFGDGSFEYALRDKSKREGQYNVYQEGILFLDAVGVALLRESPLSSVSKAQRDEKLKELSGFYFKKLSAQTAILKLPSFEYQYLAEINELISKYGKAIEESENLIIDLRGNPGGTTDAYQKLLPYLFSNGIRHTGAEFLATQTYINNLEAYKKTLAKNTPTTGLDKQIKKLQENLGQFVSFSDTSKASYIEKVEPAAKSPRQVIVLADKGTGSSAEYFLFILKQSKKVKILGKPSYGALDFGNAYLNDFGCPNYQVLMPTYRAMRLPDYPIDNIGIQPDIYLDNSIKDWVAFAWRYAEE